MATIGIGNLKATIRGTTALCMHCAQAVDPMCKHPSYKAFKKLSGKRMKTDEDHLEMAKLEWELSLYVNVDGKLYLPGQGIEAALKDMAKARKLGKKFNAFVQVDDAVLKFPDADKSLEELWASEKYYIRSKMRVGTASIMRTTPRFNLWSADLSITFRTSQVDEETVLSVLADCGALNGMFEFRPRYGHFEIMK